MANLYEILGVPEEASREDIKASYRKLSRRYHPDMTGDAEGHFFKMLAEAHETLTDPEKRAAYDASLNSTSPPTWETPPGYTEAPNSSAQQQAGIPASAPIDWDSVKWKQQKYSTREKVILPKPFKGRATLFTFLAVPFIIAAGIMTFQLPLFHGFPLAMIAVLAIAVFGIQLGRIQLNEKWFGAISAIIIAANIVFMVNTGAELNNIAIISVFLALASALIIYAYLSYVKWIQIQHSRGTLTMSTKQAKTGKKWASTVRTIHPGGEADQRANTVAEKRTDRLVQELVTIPGTRMLSGVLHPTSTWEKVQHVAINGDKVYLVDSLMLPGGKYYWLDRDTISAVRPAGYEYDIEVGTPTALREFKFSFPEADFKACIILYSLDGGEVNLADDNKSHDGVELFTQQDFIEDAGDWFTEGKLGIVNRGLLNGLVNRL